MPMDESTFAAFMIDGAVQKDKKIAELEARVKELKECVRIGLDYIDSNSVADKFEAALAERVC